MLGAGLAAGLLKHPGRRNPLDALKDRAAAQGRPLGAEEGMALLEDPLAGALTSEDRARAERQKEVPRGR